MSNSCVGDITNRPKNLYRAKGVSPEEHQNPNAPLYKKSPFLERSPAKGVWQISDEKVTEASEKVTEK